jgi:phosphatidylserine/phosphatidylglycerophosphate/cardiolipin synthase-like enzyme
MTELLRSPWGQEFERLVEAVDSSLVLCAPYVGSGPCELVAARIGGRAGVASVEICVLTDLSRDNILSGSTDVASLLRLTEAVPRTVIRFLPSLHAKVYIADDKRAVITSSNFTDSGMYRNFEYGVCLQDRRAVMAVRADILRYSELGSPVDQHQLRTFVRIAEDLRDLSREAQRSVDRRLRQEFDRRLAAADLAILRARAAGRTAHAIFADTILHLLTRGPLRTADLNQEIQRIHPDLCDDSVDRVIDGQHFGKKWKHGVRTAQVYLRRSGRIERAGDSWRLVR